MIQQNLTYEEFVVEDPGSTREAIRARLDPASAAGLQAYLDIVGPLGINGIANLDDRRARMRELNAVERALTPLNPGVTIDEFVVPGLAGDPEVPVRCYRRADALPSTGARPGVLFIHGGGMVLGDLDGDEVTAVLIADEVDAVVLSVGYRLAPEYPFPAAPHDCYAALLWFVSHAEELGVDPARVAVYGGSAGGGLSIATALIARDRQGPSIAFLMAIYPMIDDRGVTPSSQSILDLGAWDREGNLQAWAWYLGTGTPSASLHAYAAPARAADLRGLPPTFIDVGDLDLFRDEDIEFAGRLAQAEVPCELHVYPGAFHASELFAPQAPLSQQIVETRMIALRRALHGA